MMDTVLNIGLNDAVAAGLAKLTRRRALRRTTPTGGWCRCSAPSCWTSPTSPSRRCSRATAPRRGVANDADLAAATLLEITAEFKAIVKARAKRPFPEDPVEQLRLATEAVFRSWNGKRAIDYRNAAGIAHDLGTAVNIQTMVFGNMGADSGTGVAHDAQRHHRRARARGRLPHQRAGRGRRGRHARDEARSRRSGPRCPRIHAELARNLPHAGEALPRRAGRGVHHRARQAVDAADARRQAHRAGGRAHRRGPRRREAHHARRGRGARLPGPRRRLPAPAVRREGQGGREEARRLARHRPQRLAGRGRRRPRLRRRHRRAVGREGAARPSSWCAPRPSPTTCTACSRPRASSPAAAGAPATPRWSRGSSASPRSWACSAMEVDLEKREFTIGGPRLPRGRRGVHRRHHGRGVRRQPQDRRAGVRRPVPREAARLGRRVPPPGRVGQRRLPGRRRARARLRRRRASGCAAPSTCSSRPSACRSCSR